MSSSRISKLAIDLRDGFWLRPISLLLLGAAAGIGSTRLDRWLVEVGRVSPFTASASPGGARALLSVAAGALATTLAISLSMTMITVQLASSQYTPRLLRRFLSDARTQLTVGSFLAVITFQFLVLRAVRSPDEGDSFVPLLSLSVASIATLVCLALLVVFLHRTMRSMQASTLIAEIGRETVTTLQELAPLERRPDAHVPSQPEHVVRATGTGYVQLLDEASLAACAPDCATAIRREAAPGDFVFPGTPLATVFADRALSSSEETAVRETFTLGRERTTAADLTFGIRQLVDMALRALSPGINDVTTAVMVVNELGAIARAIAKTGRAKEAWRRISDYDPANYITRELSLDSYLVLAYDEIVAASDTNPRVRERIVEILLTIQQVEQATPTQLVLRAYVEKVRGVSSTRRVHCSSDRR